MPPCSKTTKSVRALNSSDKAVQAIVSHLTTLSTELDDLRARHTHEALEKRAQDLKASIVALIEFRKRLGGLCDRFQSDLEDLFCDHLWEEVHWSLPGAAHLNSPKVEEELFG